MILNKQKLALVVSSVLTIFSTIESAHAGVLFDNTNLLATDAGCGFGSMCAEENGLSNLSYAAQLFTLSSTSTLTSASFTDFLVNSLLTPTSVNWAIYQTNDDGLPTTSIFSGTASITPSFISTASASVGSYSVYNELFSLPALTLGTGTFAFSIQANTRQIGDYLMAGASSSGGAETFDGGQTWQNGYAGFSSISIAINGVSPVPEAEEWAMMMLGLPLIGYVARRRQQAA